MKKLWMINIGGKAPGATIEVHDVQFIIAETMEETEAVLRQHWYGLPLKLHLDGYKCLEGVEGYRIEIREEAPIEQDKLFFLHIGGYAPEVFGELHKVGFLVRPTLQEAKLAAKDHLFVGEVQEHVDSTIDISQAPLLNAVTSGYIHLVPTEENFSLAPDWQGYKRIDEV